MIRHRRATGPTSSCSTFLRVHYRTLADIHISHLSPLQSDRPAHQLIKLGEGQLGRVEMSSRRTRARSCSPAGHAPECSTRLHPAHEGRAKSAEKRLRLLTGLTSDRNLNSASTTCPKSLQQQDEHLSSTEYPSHFAPQALPTRQGLLGPAGSSRGRRPLLLVGIRAVRECCR